MSRRKSKQNLSRKPAIDHKYQSEVVGRMINMLMMDGKRQLACRIVYAAIDRLVEVADKNSLIAAKSLGDGKEPDDRETEGGDEGESRVDSSQSVESIHALSVLNTVLDIAGPELELVSKRLGGQNIQQPVPVRAKRRVCLALRAIIRNARDRVAQAKGMINALSQEMIDVLKGHAKTLDQKEQTLRMARANAVFQGMRRGG